MCLLSFVDSFQKHSQRHSQGVLFLNPVMLLIQMNGCTQQRLPCEEAELWLNPALVLRLHLNLFLSIDRQNSVYRRTERQSSAPPGSWLKFQLLSSGSRRRENECFLFTVHSMLCSQIGRITITLPSATACFFYSLATKFPTMLMYRIHGMMQVGKGSVSQATADIMQLSDTHMALASQVDLP